MSIFKETLDPEIQTQLKARTLVVSGENNNKSNLLPWYLSKNAWVRMTSFVDYDEGPIDFDGLGGIIINPITGPYTGNKLSEKYILEGGTLYKNRLRQGIASPGAIYGSDLDYKPGFVQDAQYFQQLGIRPMPGITDVRMRTIGAYGSLFETTVNFHAWDTNQLNELEILFMRPGYSVLLEWGWSQYIDYTDVKAANKLTQTDIFPTVFSGQTINPFNTKYTPNTIYQLLEELRKINKFNYDGMLGYVKNFNWKLRKDGGYDCSTTLISMGEVINTLKMNSNANQINNRTTFNSESDISYVYDDFENVLISLKTNVEGTYQSNTFRIGEDLARDSAYRGSWDYDFNYVELDTIKGKLKTFGYDKQAELLGEKAQPYRQHIKTSGEDQWLYGRFYEYLTLDVVVALISSFTNLRARTKGESDRKGGEVYPLVKVIAPNDEDYCLAGPDSISVTPSICNVLNKGAFLPEIKAFNFKNGHDDKELGIYPSIQTANGSYISKQLQYFDKSPNVKAGRINRILVNIDFLLNVYKDLKNSSNESGVIMTDYLKNVLNKISNALGGLNNFTLSTAGRDQNILRIIDTYYFGQGSDESFNSKYQFDLLGLGSICKDVSIQSQIFQEQSTIVAIAAQSKANLGDVYNSTQVYLNAGIKDRLAVAKWQADEENSTSNPNNSINNSFYKKLVNLMSYARTYLIGDQSETNFGTTDYVINADTSNFSASSILKSSLLRYDGEMNFKALIPFKLRITLEGIGGIVVGQIFTVKQNILPKNYYDKKLGFVITQIEHVLNNNQWETILDTQICILDQQQFYDANGKPKSTKNIVREGLGDYVSIQSLRAILWPILVDFITYQATRSYVGFSYAFAGTSQNLSAAYEELYDNPNSNDIKDYWKNNVPFFIGLEIPNPSIATTNLNPKNYSKVYNMVDGNALEANFNFEDFFIAWMETWASQQTPETLAQKWSSDLTVQDIVDYTTKTDASGALLFQSDRDEFKDFKDDFEQIIKWFNNNKTFWTNVFYPNNSSESLYKVGNNIVVSGDRSILKGYRELIESQAETGTAGVNFYTYHLEGWNANNLAKKIEELADRNPGARDVKNTYNNAPNVTQNRIALTTLFNAYSKVMYGDTNSLMFSYSAVKDGALQNFGFNSKGVVNDENAKDKVWFNTIPWNSGFGGGRGIIKR